MLDIFGVRFQLCFHFLDIDCKNTIQREQMYIVLTTNIFFLKMSISALTQSTAALSKVISAYLVHFTAITQVNT